MFSEVNFDGLVGPTHNYSGLSYGNVASLKFQHQTSNPRDAALQGLAKMKYLMDLGLKQAFLPPQERPHLPSLRALGFEGSDEVIIAKAFKEAPQLFFACSSASCMWTANAATVSPSVDSHDRLVHITPANLLSKFHRSIEAQETWKTLHNIFADDDFFQVHPCLPNGAAFSDEGAANHTRFCKTFGEPGVQLFVFGRQEWKNVTSPLRFPARQTAEACEAIARRHKLNVNQVIVAQQNPKAIDAGVFHNDVISVGHQNVFFYHELAFVDTEKVIEEIRRKVENVCQVEAIFIKVPEKSVSLQDAVKSYMFNSQIVTLQDGSMHLLAPQESQEIPSVHNFLESMIASGDNPINSIHYFDLRQSMQNGGGPACLRLRVVLSEQEIQALHPYTILTNEHHRKLVEWVKRYYRDRLSPEDVADPQFYRENQKALEELKNKG